MERLQGSLKIEYTLATVGAEKLWKLMHDEPFVPALGALTGNQAMQQIRAGLKAVYCSGWQVDDCTCLAFDLWLVVRAQGLHTTAPGHQHGHLCQGTTTYPWIALHVGHHIPAEPPCNLWMVVQPVLWSTCRATCTDC